MACICSVMGISTLILRASPTAALVVSTPSATLPCIPAMISVQLSGPCPGSTPTVRLRERPPVQVSTRSPEAGKPGHGLGSPAAGHYQAGDLRQPAGDERSGRVVALSPMPSTMPLAMAMIFFSAPPSSTPIISSLV